MPITFDGDRFIFPDDEPEKEQDLIRIANSQGEEAGEAFNELYKMHQDELAIYVRGMILIKTFQKNTSNVADFVSQAFIDAWNIFNRGAFIEGRSFLTMLKGFAYCTMIDYDRKRANLEVSCSPLPNEKGVTYHSDQIYNTTPLDFCAQREIGEMVSGLDPDCREVINCQYFLGLSMNETAVRVGITIGAVKYHTRKAMGELRKMTNT